MTAVRSLRLIMLGSAKRLTQAQLPTGMQEGEDATDRWGV